MKLGLKEYLLTDHLAWVMAFAMNILERPVHEDHVQRQNLAIFGSKSWSEKRFLYQKDLILQYSGQKSNSLQAGAIGI